MPATDEGFELVGEDDALEALLFPDTEGEEKSLPAPAVVYVLPRVGSGAVAKGCRLKPGVYTGVCWDELVQELPGKKLFGSGLKPTRVKSIDDGITLVRVSGRTLDGKKFNDDKDVPIFTSLVAAICDGI